MITPNSALISSIFKYLTGFGRFRCFLLSYATEILWRTIAFQAFFAHVFERIQHRGST
jgi:hypothetical protein